MGGDVSPSFMFSSTKVSISFFFKQKTAYEIASGDWSSDVCSSDLVQEGLIAACDCIDLIIAILRGSKNLKDAKACLTTGDVTNIHFKVPGFEEDAKKLAFTERQASAILEMRLYKLIGLEILALEKEHRETLRRCV